MSDHGVTPETRLAALGVELPPIRKPAGQFVPAVRTGRLVFVSGHISMDGDHVLQGTLGGNLDVEAGRAAARSAALGCLASLRAEVGTLNRVRRIVKVLGLVHATPDFRDHPAVVNGASELLREVFGPDGEHARSAVGMSSLPLGAAVEVELVAEVSDDTP